MISHPLIDPFVTAAEQRETCFDMSEFSCDALIEPSTSRTQEQQWPGKALCAFHALHSPEDRLGHEDHARASSEGSVID